MNLMDVVKRRTRQTAMRERAFEIGRVTESSELGITMETGVGEVTEVPGLSARLPMLDEQELILRMSGNENNPARLGRSPYLRGEKTVV